MELLPQHSQLACSDVAFFSEVQTCNKYSQQFAADFESICIGCQVNISCYHEQERELSEVTLNCILSTRNQKVTIIKSNTSSELFLVSILHLIKKRKPVPQFSLKKTFCSPSFILLILLPQV
jgi:hypothetical protein